MLRQYTLTSTRTGAIGALLNKYGKAITELINAITGITSEHLKNITDPDTEDDNCRSVQTILTHLVHSGLGYATSIGNMYGQQKERPAEQPRETIPEYCADLEWVFLFTENILSTMKDDDLEQKDDTLKIKTAWGQRYDAEQMMEHAIVHILRHRRQIESFKEKHLLI